jgi:hypothetical protein
MTAKTIIGLGTFPKYRDVIHGQAVFQLATARFLNF